MGKRFRKVDGPADRRDVRHGRREADAALRASEQQYRTLAEATRDVILILDADGRLEYANSRAAELFRATPDDLIGSHVDELFPPDTAADQRGSLDQVLSAGGSSHAVRLVRFPDRELWLSTVLVALEDDQGERTSVLAVSRDVTDLKQVERRLRDTETELRQVINSIPGYLWSLEASSTGEIRRRYYSDKVQTITGRGPEFFMAGPDRLLSTVHPDDRSRVMQTVERALSGRSAQEEQEYRVVRPDGGIRWVLDRVSVRRTDEGVIGLTGVVLDITTRKEAQAGRLEAEGRFRLLLESLSDGIILVANGGAIQWANAAGCRMFGYRAPGYLSDRSIYDLLDPANRERARRRGRALYAGESFQPTEYLGLRKDGSFFPIEISSRLVQDGGTAALLCTIRDISERRTLEERLRRAQKMDAVGRLAGGVAHDFNNLLTIIRGYADIQLMRLGPEDPLRRTATKIQEATSQAADVSGRLLEFSRKQVVQPTVFDLNRLITESEGVMRRLAAADVRFSTRLASQLHLVRADRGQIAQVLLNLILNARDAMPDGGELTVTSDNVELDAGFVRGRGGLEPGAHVRVTVSDTGVGISDEMLQQIFEPFFTTKGGGRGTGLGLSTVYGVMQESGGDVEVQSAVGGGTTFSIYFPAAGEVAEPAVVDAARPGRRAAPACVLVAEDEAEVRALVSDLLREAGHHVLEAASGGDALRLVDSHTGTIDLLVADVVMPGMSGRELADRLTALRPTLKVLYISGYTPDQVLRHGVRNQATTLLRKPFTLDELDTKVNALLVG